MDSQVAVKESESVIPVVRNIVDNADDLSVSSISSLDHLAGDALREGDGEEGEVKEEGEAAEKKEDESASKKEEGEEEEKPPVKKETDPVQKRINDLTKKWRSTERALEFEKSKRQEVEAELRKVKSTVPATDKPKVADFETEAEFVEALTDWKIEQRIKSEKENVSKVVKETEEKKAIDETYSVLDEIMEQGREKFEDFDDLVLAKGLVLTEAMTEAVLFSDKADEILYYLGKHPDFSAKIAGLPPLRIAQELGKIEEKLSQPPPAKKTTETPPPIKPLKTKGVVEKDPSQMSPKEYRAWREKNK